MSWPVRCLPRQRTSSRTVAMTHPPPFLRQMVGQWQSPQSGLSVRSAGIAPSDQDVGRSPSGDGLGPVEHLQGLLSGHVWRCGRVARIRRHLGAQPGIIPLACIEAEDTVSSLGQLIDGVEDSLELPEHLAVRQNQRGARNGIGEPARSRMVTDVIVPGIAPPQVRFPTGYRISAACSVEQPTAVAPMGPV